MRKKDLLRKNMVESVANERNILAMANNPFVVRFFYRSAAAPPAATATAAAAAAAAAHAAARRGAPGGALV